MVLSGATQKIQTMIELAEELYEKVTEVREQVMKTQDTVEDTHERVVALEEELVAQRAILDALAAEHGLDVDVDVGVNVDAAEEPVAEGSDEPAASEEPLDEEVVAGSESE